MKYRFNRPDSSLVDETVASGLPRPDFSAKLWETFETATARLVREGREI